MESPNVAEMDSGTFYPQLSDSFQVPKNHLFKVLVVGEYAVGKTSLIKRYTEGYFSPNYKLTIGVDFALKVIDWDEDTKVNLQLWDVAGHERFGYMTRVYYKYAIAAIIVFDLGRANTFDAVMKWYIDINNCIMLANGNPIPVLLLANKCDLQEENLDHKMLNEFCKEHGFIGWFPTSAKENVNIDDAMNFLIGHVLKIQGHRQPDMNDCVLLPGHSSQITNSNISSSKEFEKKRCSC